MKKLTCLIVDDEPMARLSLERLCERRPELSIFRVCNNGVEALEVLQNSHVDLLFLDIEMPKLTGIQLLEQLPYLPMVVMTTTKTDYAFDAFQYQAVDYLKKPIAPNRFMQAMDRVIEKVKNLQTQPQIRPNDIFVKVEGRYIRLSFDDLLYIENFGDYVKIRTSSQQYVVYSTMKLLEGKLPPESFYRVHRSFIVNLSKIIDIEDSNLVLEGKIIPISRSNRPGLMDRLNLL